MPTLFGCPLCDQSTEQGRYCSEHSRLSALDGLLYCYDFQVPGIREAIHDLKYGGIRELAQPLGLLIAALLEAHPFCAGWPTIAMPLAKGRQLERGFNQSQLLAAQLGWPLLDGILLRHKTRTPQAQLNRAQRLENVKGIFCLSAAATVAGQLKGREIIVIDDVATTGSTLNEAAAILKTAGAAAVWGVVVARDFLADNSN